MMRARQQAILDRCYHPTGGWVEFTRDWLERSLPVRFEDQVARHPRRLAVKIGAEQLTYAGLNRAANRVALSPQVLFQTPTVADLALAVTQAQASQADPADVERLLMELDRG